MLSRRNRLVGRSLRVRGTERSARERAGDEAAGVGVDQADVALEREHELGARRVRADAGKRQERIEIVRQNAVVLLVHDHRSTMQVDRTPVVAETVPRVDHVAD